MPRLFNAYVRERWAKYCAGKMSASEKQQHRQCLRDRQGTDELLMTAARWLDIQRASLLWPYAPRTSAFGQRFEHCGNQWAPRLP